MSLKAESSKAYEKGVPETSRRRGDVFLKLFVNLFESTPELALCFLFN